MLYISLYIYIYAPEIWKVLFEPMTYIVSWSLNLLALHHDVIIRERPSKTNRDCQQTSDSKQGE